jgi:hypothetical protein
VMASIKNPAAKKRAIQITKGWAYCNPILVAVAAEGQRIAKSSPAPKSRHAFDGGFFDWLSWVAIKLGD